ncbi:kinetochore-associated protein 1-like [Glandiceps talaboti]
MSPSHVKKPTLAKPVTGIKIIFMTNLLALWLEKKARNMELVEKTDWPQNALELAELMFTPARSVTCPRTMKQCMLGTADSMASSASDGVQGVKLLEKLIQQLKELISLHNEYSCHLTLAEFSQETTSTITFRMLDRVAAPELVPQAITKVVRPYMKQHNLPEEELLFKYIEDLIDRCGNMSSYCYEASWEARAVSVIQSIKDPDNFCQAVYSLMLKATVPWSDLIENIVKQGFELDHPRVKQLKECCQLVKLKTLLLKYDLYTCSIVDESQASQLLTCILHKDMPSTMDDALQVIKVYSQLKKEDAYMFRLRYLLQHERIPECIELLKSLASEDSVVYAKRLLVWTLNLLEEEEIDQCCEQDEDADCTEYIEDQHKEKLIAAVSGLAVTRFLLSMEELESVTREELKETLNDVGFIHKLQVEYNKFLSLEEYRDHTVREVLLRDYLIAFFSGNLENSSQLGVPKDPDRKSGNATKVGYNKVYRLAELLGISVDELKGQLAVQAAKNGQVETAIEKCKDLYELVPDEKTGAILYTVAHTLCYIQAETGSVYSGSQWYSSQICQLACQAAIICHTDLLADCQMLLNCTRLTDHVYQQCENADCDIGIQNSCDDRGIARYHRDDPYYEWQFNDYYEEDGLVLDPSLAMPLANQFTLSCLPQVHASDHRQPLQQDSVVGMAEHDVEHDEDRGQNIIENVNHCSANIVSLLQEHSLGLAYTLKTILICLQYRASRTTTHATPDSDTDLDDVMKLCITHSNLAVQKYSLNLLHKILGSKKVDVELAFGFSIVLPQQKTLDKLQSICSSTGHNYTKIMAISKVGKKLAQYYQDPELLASFAKLGTKATWGHKLEQLQITFRDAFSSDQTQDYQNLLPQIIQHGDVEMFKDYCRAFNLHEESALLLYVETLLLPPRSTAKNEPPALDKGLVIYVLNHVSNKEALQLKLNLILDQVNFYDYERIDFLLGVIKNDCPLSEEEVKTVDQGLKLLEYLTVYTRCSKASQYEVAYRYKTEEDQLLHDSESLPHLAETKLPFHPLMYGNPWKIVTPELNADSVCNLLPVAEVLKLSPEKLHLVAIENEMKEVKKQWEQQEDIFGVNNDSIGWNSNRKMDVNILEKLKNLLLNIKDCRMAVAAARFIVKELPRGSDQVIALKFCKMLALRWKELAKNNPSEAEMATHASQKITDVYKRLATEQVLYKYNLSEPAHLELTNQPAGLIFKLYEHKSIEERGNEYISSLPDIHAAADKIAAVNEYNIHKIRLALFEKWLPSQECKTDRCDDDTSVFGTKSHELTEDERNLKRVMYILQLGSREGTALFLWNYLSKPSAELTNTSCIRIMQCLFSLVGKEVIEKISSQPVERIRFNLQTLVYLTDLETLNMTYSVAEFTKCNKEELVRRIWRNHSHEPKAVKLISDLCLDNKIYDIQLWNGVLQQLMVFSMINYLHYVVIQLSVIPNLWQIPSLIRSWRTAVLQPLTVVFAPLSDEQMKICHESLLLLLRCPVVSDMDMIAFSRQFIKLQMTAHALACLLLVSNVVKRKQQIQALLSTACHSVILNQVQDLSTMRLLLPQEDQIVGTVFDNIVNTQQYTVMLSSPQHLDRLYQYLAKECSINDVLLKLLHCNRIDESRKLVNVYYEHNPETLANHTVKDNADNTMKKLKIYMETHNLFDKVPGLRNKLDI